MKYAMFWGCLIPAREPNYEVSVRKIMPALGVELVEMEGTNCCAPFGIQSLDYMSWLALAARNLCIGEEMGFDIVTLCNDCYESLLMVNKMLKTDPELRNQVNEILAEVGKEYKGKVDVKNMVDILYDDVGIEKIKDIVKNPFTGLKVATQPGCHLTKPRKIHFGEREFDVLDELVRATGAETIDYDRRKSCCGGPLRGVNDELARDVARMKLISIKNAGAECIVTVCPFCFLELDMSQLEIKRHYKEEYNLPVLHFAELLRMAMGMKLDDWEIKLHRVPLNPVLKDRLQEE
jgi:heterodisulfide reductase subunit B